MKSTARRRRTPAPKPASLTGDPAALLVSLEDCRQQCSAIAGAFAARFEEGHASRDFEGEAAANSAAQGIAMFMAFIPAASLAELLLKARAARSYVARVDGTVPEDPLERLWLSIADDIVGLAEGGWPKAVRP